MKGLMRTTTLPVGVLCLCLLALWVTPAFSDDEETANDQYELVYEGEFLDQEKRPISGVFPLEFKLYNNGKDRKALWSEKHYVAVIDGRYEVVLGLDKPIPSEIENKTISLGVELKGKEVVRQPFEAKLVGEEVRSGVPTSGGGTCNFCETAGNAETVGGQHPSEFASANVKTLLDQHINDRKAHGGGGGSGGGGTLTTQTWTSEKAGGGGGSKTYNLSCPKNYVMTGLAGRHGAVLDSIQIVCTKMQ